MNGTFSVAGVLEALRAQPARSRGGGRVLLLVSARRDAGVTAAAQAVAQAACPGAVYAIDLDLKANALAKSLAKTCALGPAVHGCFGDTAFYSVRGPGRTPVRAAPSAFSYHRVGRSSLHVGVFDARVLPPNVRVTVSSQPDYWHAARERGATVVVDAPALERSKVALRVAPHMDGVVLVVGSEAGAAPAALAAKAALTEAGANVIGLVYSGAAAPVLAIERFLRKAG